MVEKSLLQEIQEDYKRDKKKPRRKVKTQAQLELERVKRFRSFIRWVLFILFLVVVIVAGVVYAAERYVDWRTERELQNPFAWVGFVREIKTLSPVSYAKETEPSTDMEVIEQYKLAPVLKSVYMLESTQGLNDGCKDEGKYNGYGYAQNSDVWRCYDSFDDVTYRVNAWFEDRLAMNGNNLAEAVCYYNTGIAWQETCGDYSANFWSVITNYF